MGTERIRHLGVEFQTGEDIYPAEPQIHLVTGSARNSDPQPNHVFVAALRAAASCSEAARNIAAATTKIRSAGTLSRLKSGSWAGRDSGSLY